MERSLGWFSRNRRLSKDYEKLPEVSEAWIYLVSLPRLLKRRKRDPLAPRPYATAR